MKSSDSRAARQDDGDSDDNAIDIGAVAAAGERCVEKVIIF